MIFSSIGATDTAASSTAQASSGSIVVNAVRAAVEAAQKAKAAAEASSQVSGQTILLVTGIGLAAFFGIKKLREKR